MTKKRAQTLVLVGTGLAVLWWLWYARREQMRRVVASTVTQTLWNQPPLI